MKKLGRRNSREIKDQNIEFEKVKYQKMETKEKLLLVKQKLSKLSKNSKLQETVLEALASKLCDEKKLKKFYLNTNFKSVLEYFEIETPKSEGIGISSGSGNTKSLVNTFEDVGEEVKIELSEYPEPIIKHNDKLKIKLVLTENARTKTQKTIRKFASPFIDAFEVGDSSFGMIHSAIAIGW
jgi:hypothetical protein